MPIYSTLRAVSRDADAIYRPSEAKEAERRENSPHLSSWRKLSNADVRARGSVW